VSSLAELERCTVNSQSAIIFQMSHWQKNPACFEPVSESLWPLVHSKTATAQTQTGGNVPSCKVGDGIATRLKSEVQASAKRTGQTLGNKFEHAVFDYLCKVTGLDSKLETQKSEQVAKKQNLP
jgi:hypothetical protein